MAFTQETVKTPTTIGGIRVVMDFPVDENLTPVADADKTIRGRVEIYDQNDEPMDGWGGNLRPHLTGAQLTALSDFLDALRTQANTELL